MKVIVSPAKEMKLEDPINKDWEISNKAGQVVSALKELDTQGLGKILKIKGDLLEKNRGYIKGFSRKESYRAIDLYNGLVFRNMDLSSLNEEERFYLGEKLLILSALYGPICGFTRIKPYRLDFNTPLKVEGQSLKSFWKNDFNQVLDQGEVILNLASREFSDLFDKKNFVWIDFDFYENNKGKEKRHSTISKKARGKMVSFLCRNQIQEIEEIKAFNLDGYQFDQDKSVENKLVFFRDL